MARNVMDMLCKSWPDFFTSNLFLKKNLHYHPDKIYHIKNKSNLKRIKKKNAVLITVLYSASVSHNNTSNNSDQLTNQNNKMCMSMRRMMPIKGNKEVDCYCNIKKKYCLIKLFKICKNLVDCHTNTSLQMAKTFEQLDNTESIK